jgi:hypothetical protein
MAEPKVKRVPVSFLWSKLNWDFLKMLAEIAQYAEDKYGSAEQYTNARLENQASPINHIYEHLRQYQAGEPHDRFGDARYHLAAIAYNAMIEFFYHTALGHKLNVIMQRQRGGEDFVVPLGGKMHIETAGEYKANGDLVSALATTVTAASAGWAEGFSHFQQRWQAGLEGARTPEAIAKWKAMLGILEQFAEVAPTDDVIMPLIDDLKKAEMDALAESRTPEATEACQARLAALVTLKVKIPDMFPAKAAP